MHTNSQLLFEAYAKRYFKPRQRVLELGADGDPSTYRRALDGVDLQWETADLADEVMAEVAPQSRFTQAGAPKYLMPNEYEIPVPDNSFDVVIAGQVIEHVRRIWVWIGELARVTRSGGNVVIISPISWDYHEAPVDCWRIYPEGMRSLCTEADLEVVTCEFAALEPPISRRQYFGNSFLLQASASKPNPVKMAVKRAVGWPLPTSLDLITIAKKP